MRNGRFEMLVSDELMARVDEWRGRQTVPPTRAAAIRYLIECGLTPGFMASLTPDQRAAIDEYDGPEVSGSMRAKLTR